MEKIKKALRCDPFMGNYDPGVKHLKLAVAIIIFIFSFENAGHSMPSHAHKNILRVPLGGYGDMREVMRREANLAGNETGNQGQLVNWLSDSELLFETKDGGSVNLVGIIPQARGKESEIEPSIGISGRKILDSSEGFNIVEIEGVNDVYGIPKYFVLKRQISPAMLKRYPGRYTLRDNGERTLFALDLLKLLLGEEFKEYAITLPEVRIIEEKETAQRFIATEYIDQAKPLRSNLIYRDDSGEMAKLRNHDLLDVYCGFLLYMQDREFLSSGGELIPFDLETALAPIFYMKNGEVSHAYNATGYAIRGRHEEYVAVANRIKSLMLDERGKLKEEIKNKIIVIIERSGLVNNTGKITVGEDALEIITAEKILTFLEAQAKRIVYSVTQENRPPALVDFTGLSVKDLLDSSRDNRVSSSL